MWTCRSSRVGSFVLSLNLIFLIEAFQAAWNFFFLFLHIVLLRILNTWFCNNANSIKFSRKFLSRLVLLLKIRDMSKPVVRGNLEGVCGRPRVLCQVLTDNEWHGCGKDRRLAAYRFDQRSPSNSSDQCWQWHQAANPWSLKKKDMYIWGIMQWTLWLSW